MLLGDSFSLNRSITRNCYFNIIHDNLIHEMSTHVRSYKYQLMSYPIYLSFNLTVLLLSKISHA